jgi:hypothetical protein
MMVRLRRPWRRWSRYRHKRTGTAQGKRPVIWQKLLSDRS